MFLSQQCHPLCFFDEVYAPRNAADGSFPPGLTTLRANRDDFWGQNWPNRGAKVITLWGQDGQLESNGPEVGV